MKTNIETEKNQSRTSFTSRCINSCRKLLAQIEDVKDQVLAEFHDRLDENQHVLELAVNEAEALAWQTDYPQLLFPSLATEKAAAVANWHTRQQSLRNHNLPKRLAA